MRKSSKTAGEPLPPKRQASASRRRPVTDLDDAISRAVDRLKPAGVPRYQLAEAAGRDANHALRMFASPPRQTWTVSELQAYAAALGVSVSAILVAAGVDEPAQSLTERVLTDPELSASDAGIIVSLLALMRRARAADQN